MLEQEHIETHYVEHTRTPEENLIRAIIRQAIMDRLHLSDEADRWLYAAGDVADSSAFLFHGSYFEELCERVGMSPESVRQRLKSVEAKIGTGLLSKHSKALPRIADYIMGDLTPVKYTYVEDEED